jgi:hypothetical protein
MNFMDNSGRLVVRSRPLARPLSVALCRCLAAALAFIIPSLVHAHTAQALVPEAARAYFNVVMPPAPMCEHQSYPVLVSVLPGSRPTGEAIKSRAEAPRGLIAISVDALVRDASIGFVNPGQGVTGMAGFDEDDLESQPGVINFTLYTKSAGTTELYFEALVKGEYLEATVPLTVEACEVEVTVISTWHVPGEANLALAASIHRAPMNADENGRLIGTGTVKWFVVSGNVADCQEKASLVTTSRVDLTGQLAEGGGISLNVVYDATQVPLVQVCANAEGSITGNPTVVVVPHAISLQAPASGATFILDQILDGPEATPGEAVVAVRPVKQ